MSEKEHVDLLYRHMQRGRNAESKGRMYVAIDEYVVAATSLHFLYMNERIPGTKAKQRDQLKALLGRIEELKSKYPRKKLVQDNKPSSTTTKKKVIPQPQPVKPDPNETQKRELIKSSIQFEKEATIFYTAGDVNDSYDNYVKSAKCLLSARKLEPDNSKRKNIEVKLEELLSKAEELKKLVDMTKKKITPKQKVVTPVKKPGSGNYGFISEERRRKRTKLIKEGVENYKLGMKYINSEQNYELGLKYLEFAISFYNRAVEFSEEDEHRKNWLIEQSRELAGYISLKVIPQLERLNIIERGERWYSIKIHNALELSKEGRNKYDKGFKEAALGCFQQSHKLFKQILIESPKKLLSAAVKINLCAKTKQLEQKMDNLKIELGLMEKELSPSAPSPTTPVEKINPYPVKPATTNVNDTTNINTSSSQVSSSQVSSSQVSSSQISSSENEDLENLRKMLTGLGEVDSSPATSENSPSSRFRLDSSDESTNKLRDALSKINPNEIKSPSLSSDISEPSPDTDSSNLKIDPPPKFDFDELLNLVPEDRPKSENPSIQNINIENENIVIPQNLPSPTDLDDFDNFFSELPDDSDASSLPMPQSQVNHRNSNQINFEMMNNSKTIIPTAPTPTSEVIKSFSPSIQSERRSESEISKKLSSDPYSGFFNPNFVNPEQVNEDHEFMEPPSFFSLDEIKKEISSDKVDDEIDFDFAPPPPPPPQHSDHLNISKNQNIMKPRESEKKDTVFDDSSDEEDTFRFRGFD